MKSKTDHIKEVINAEIERRRKSIDAADDLRSVSVIVIVPRGKAERYKTLYRTEEQSVSIATGN